MESRRESDYCWVCLWTRASRVVDLPVRPHASFPRLLKLSLILCWHSEAGKPSFKYEHMMEAQDFCTVCVCVSAFFLWCHKTSLLCGSKRAFIRRVKRFLRHSNTGRMFPALIVCDQRFTSNCSEHFELWKITKWSANGKTGPWNRDTRVEVTTPGDKETAVFALCFYCVHIQQSY